MVFGKCRLPARLSLAFLCATGVMELYMSRINLSIAIVAMVQIVSSEGERDTGIREPYCYRGNDSTYTLLSMTTNFTLSQNGSFDGAMQTTEDSPPIKMTTTERGNILSAFFYAYWISAIPGGRLADLYGTKVVFGIAGVMDGLGNLLIPVASKTRTELLFLIRFIMGLTQGACYPALNSLVSRWIPPDETSRFMSFVAFGKNSNKNSSRDDRMTPDRAMSCTFFNLNVANSFGTIFMLSSGGLIISAIGWEWVFYISGCLSFTWVTIWTLLMHDDPEDHPRISLREKTYIQEAKRTARRLAPNEVWAMFAVMLPKVPWKDMALSRPLWGLALAQATNMFGLSLFLTQLPIYFSSIIGVSIKNNGLLSSLPFLARFIGSNISSWLSNFLMKKISLYPKTWKIVITFIGFVGPAISVVSVGYSGCSASAALSFFILGLALNGANASGYISNVVEIAPSFSGTAFGAVSTVGFFYAMVVPVIIGALTTEETLSEWILVYWICFANYTIGAALYSLLMSTDAQPWNYIKQGNADVEMTQQSSEVSKNAIDVEETEKMLPQQKEEKC